MSRLVRYAGASIAGKHHDENQDAWSVIGHRSRDRGVLFVLSDGVSVTPEARWAANFTCQKLSERYNAETPLCETSLFDCIVSIDQRIRARGIGQAACTLSVCWITSVQCYLFKVGDSPVCHVKNGVGKFISPVKESIYLRTYLGMGEEISKAIEVHHLDLQLNDWLMLTSDGVADVYSAKELGQLSPKLEEDIHSIAESIVSTAQKRGSMDDATLVLLNYKDRPSNRLAFESFFILG